MNERMNELTTNAFEQDAQL